MLGTYTLKELRSDLQIRLNDIPPNNQYSPGVLDEWLNVAQDKLAMVLRKVKPNLYASYEQGQIGGNNFIDLPSDFAEIVDANYYAAGSVEPFSILSQEEFASRVRNSLYDSLWFGWVDVSGQKLHLPRTDNNAIDVYYLRLATTMNSDSSLMDVPDEFKDALIELALGIAKGLTVPQLDQKAELEVYSLLGLEERELNLQQAKKAVGEDK